MVDTGFWANIIDSLAWPVTVLLLVLFLTLVFRKPLGSLILRLRRVSHGREGTSFDFGPSSIRVLQPGMPEEAEIDERANNAITNDPRAAVIEAWLRFEWEANRILEHFEAQWRRDSPAAIIRALGDQDLLRGNLYEILNELRHYRNRAAHEMDLNLSSNFANEYVATGCRQNNERVVNYWK